MASRHMASEHTYVYESFAEDVCYKFTSDKPTEKLVKLRTGAYQLL